MFVNNLPYMEPEDLAELLVLFGADSAEITDNNVQANRCPFHGNNSATLGVSVEFPHPVNCFNPACSARSPDILSLVCTFLGSDAPTALYWLYDKFPNLERVKNKGDGLFKFLEEEEESEAIPLSDSVMAAYSMEANSGIGYRAAMYYNNWTKEDCGILGIGYDRVNHRLIFPVRNGDNQIVGLIGRCMSDRAKSSWYNYDKGVFKLAKCLLGDHLEIDEDAPINLFEGTSDYYHMLLAEADNPRSLMGAEFSAWQVDKLVSYDKRINIILDNDLAGRTSASKIATKLREQGCRCAIISLPLQAHDVRELTPDEAKDFMRSINRKHRLVFDIKRQTL